MSTPLRPEPRPVRLADVVRLLDARLISPAVPAEGRVEISGVSLDSRAVLPGDLYAALPGRHTHGARFARGAVAAGAAAVLTDTEGAALCADVDVPILVIGEPRRRLGAVASFVYGDPGSAMQLLAITGTNGKTTVAAMVESGRARAPQPRVDARRRTVADTAMFQRRAVGWSSRIAKR